MTKRYIGIDFGTSNTVVRYMDCSGDASVDRQLHPLSVSVDRSDMVKTLILDQANGTRRFGQSAETSSASGTGTLHRDFKMGLASEETRLLAEQLMRDFFVFLKQGCDSKLVSLKPGDTEYTFVSYPAKWSPEARTAVEKAASYAGFHNVKSLDEPSAALHACLQERIGDDSKTRLQELQREGIIHENSTLNIMLLDLGAGTTDIVLSRYNPGESSVTTLVTWPTFTSTDTFGGREVDQFLLRIVLDYMKSIGARTSEAQEKNILTSCKLWKDNSLSADLRDRGQSQEEPDAIGQVLTYQNLYDARPFPPLTRHQLEAELGSYLDTLPRLVNGAIANAVERASVTKIRSGEDIDLVILTGGHSQWYFVREMLLGQYTASGGEEINLPQLKRNEKRLLQLDSPEQTVAMGLAYQANPLKFSKVMSNNMWLSLKFGRTQLPEIKIVDQQTLLPHKQSSSRHPLQFQYFLSQHIPIVCTIMVGETLSNAIPYVATGTLDQGVFNHLFDKVVEVFSEELHSAKTWDGTYDVYVDIDESQRGSILVTARFIGGSGNVRFTI
jgi:molecular chaperone DnaK (HSP70)